MPARRITRSNSGWQKRDFNLKCLRVIGLGVLSRGGQHVPVVRVTRTSLRYLPDAMLRLTCANPSYAPYTCLAEIDNRLGVIFQCRLTTRAYSSVLVSADARLTGRARRFASYSVSYTLKEFIRYCIKKRKHIYMNLIHLRLWSSASIPETDFLQVERTRARISTQRVDILPVRVSSVSVVSPRKRASQSCAVWLGSSGLIRLSMAGKAVCSPNPAPGRCPPRRFSLTVVDPLWRVVAR